MKPVCISRIVLIHLVEAQIRLALAAISSEKYYPSNWDEELIQHSFCSCAATYKTDPSTPKTFQL